MVFWHHDLPDEMWDPAYMPPEEPEESRPKKERKPMTPRRTAATILISAVVIAITVGLLNDPAATARTVFYSVVLILFGLVGAYLIIAMLENNWKFWEDD